MLLSIECGHVTVLYSSSEQAAPDKLDLTSAGGGVQSQPACGLYNQEETWAGLHRGPDLLVYPSSSTLLWHTYTHCLTQMHIEKNKKIKTGGKETWWTWGWAKWAEPSCATHIIIHGWFNMCDPDSELVRCSTSPLCVCQCGGLLFHYNRPHQHIQEGVCPPLWSHEHTALWHLLILHCCQGNLHLEAPFLWG